MLKREIKDILLGSADVGWILEPEAKRLLSLSGIDVPEFEWARNAKNALQFAKKIGYPVVAKIVSPKVLHKTESRGVVLGVQDAAELGETFERFRTVEGFAGMLIEEMVNGVEVIVGAKSDYQFGPVVLMGLGGTGVEIYRDTALRMAPLVRDDVVSMIDSLKAHELLYGYRGSDPINLEELTRTILAFSDLIMDMEEYFESVDLNPVMCSSDRCVVADAWIILKTRQPVST